MTIRFVVCLLLSICVSAQVQIPTTLSDQLSTADHLKQGGWWPTKADAARSGYVGPQVCAECHSSLQKGQSQHAMAQTSMLAAGSSLLEHGDAQYKDKEFSYRIHEQDGQMFYSVAGRGDSFSAPLLWAFGSGSVGQSYLFESDGALFEARMSFLHGRGFDLTPGHPTGEPASLKFAVGRPIPGDEQPKCFGCHTVGSSTGENFDPAQAMLGISCEGCHGPGADHVALAKSGASTPGLIFNPARLAPAQALDFCGACHRAYWDVADVSDIHAIRFPALRLEQSKCWGNGDARLACTTCHDPHQPLVRQTAAYDGKCLSCHRGNSSEPATAEHMAPACPVAVRDCASCHIRKYEIPGMRLSFTDHKIRIIRGKSFQY